MMKIADREGFGNRRRRGRSAIVSPLNEAEKDMLVMFRNFLRKNFKMRRSEGRKRSLPIAGSKKRTKKQCDGLQEIKQKCENFLESFDEKKILKEKMLQMYKRRVRRMPMSSRDQVEQKDDDVFEDFEKFLKDNSLMPQLQNYKFRQKSRIKSRRNKTSQRRRRRKKRNKSIKGVAIFSKGKNLKNPKDMEIVEKSLKTPSKRITEVHHYSTIKSKSKSHSMNKSRDSLEVIQKKLGVKEIVRKAYIGELSFNTFDKKQSNRRRKLKKKKVRNGGIDGWQTIEKDELFYENIDEDLNKLYLDDF